MEFSERQITVLHRLIDDYRAKQLTLNTLIQRIEGVSSAIDLDPWKNAIFPIIAEMEQINAASIDSKKKLTAAEEFAIEASLKKLEQVIVSHSSIS